MGLVIAILRPFVRLFCRIVFGMQFFGTENIPATGACIITPNHVTYADPIWITIPIYRRVYYMTWSEIFRIPVLGFVARLFGAFPVRIDSVDPTAQKEAVEILKQEKALMIFPEGGRTREGARVMPFKAGAFRFALIYGLPIIPVAMKGAEKVWPASRLLPRPGKITITFLPPIQVPKIDSANKAELRQHSRELSERVRNQIIAALGENQIAEQASA